MSSPQKLLIAGLALIVWAESAAGQGVFWARANVRRIVALSPASPFTRTVVENEIDSVGGMALDPSGWVYWADGRKRAFLRTNFTGTVVETVMEDVGGAMGMAIDFENLKVYWGDFGDIRRANMDGTQRELIVPRTGSFYGINGVAVDVSAGKVFWTAQDCAHAGHLRTANLDGSDAQTFFNGFSFQLAVDQATQRVFWTTSRDVRMSYYTGLGQEMLFSTDDGYLRGFTLDEATRRLYWVVSRTPNSEDLTPPQWFYRMHIDGGPAELIGTIDDNQHRDVSWLLVHHSGSSIYYAARIGMPPKTAMVRRSLQLASPQTLLAQILGHPTGVVLDPAGDGHIYFGDEEAQTIFKVGVDGSGLTAVVGDAGPVSRIALDLERGRLYWTDGSDCYDRGAGLRRANLDGTGVTVIDADANCAGGGIVVDSNGERVYWIRPYDHDPDDNEKGVYRADLDGGGRERIISFGSRELGWDLALGSLDGKLYWTGYDMDTYEDFIRRGNLDGSQIEEIVRTPDSIEGLTVDASDGKIYWTRTGSAHGVVRVNADGTDMEEVSNDIEDGDGYVTGIAARNLFCTRTAMYADITNLEGSVEFGDVSAVVDAFRGQPTIDPTLCDLYPCDLGGRRCVGDGLIDFRDVSQVVDAFRNVYTNCPN